MNTELMFSSKTDNWATPIDFFLKVEAEFWPFDLDPCADNENHKAPKYFTKEDNGLAQEWRGRIFCNPPYWRGLKDWVRKCSEERERGSYINLPADTRKDRHELLPQLYLQQARSRNTIYQMTAEILRSYKLRTFPLYACNFSIVCPLLNT